MRDHRSLVALRQRLDHLSAPEQLACTIEPRIVPELALSLPSIALAADGAAIFKQHCATCHGATGQADTQAG